MFSPFLIYIKVEEKTYCCTYSNPYTFARTEYLTHETNKNKRFLLLLSFSNSPLHPFGCLVNVIYSGLPSKLHCFAMLRVCSLPKSTPFHTSSLFSVVENKLKKSQTRMQNILDNIYFWANIFRVHSDIFSVQTAFWANSNFNIF